MGITQGVGEVGGQFFDLVFAMREGEIKLCPHRVKKHSKTEQLQHDRTTTLSVCGEPVAMTKHRPVEEHSLCKRAIAKHLGGYIHPVQHLAKRNSQLLTKRVQPFVDPRFCLLYTSPSPRD